MSDQEQAEATVHNAQIRSAEIAMECEFWDAVDRGDKACVAEILALIWVKGERSGIEQVSGMLDGTR